MPTRTVLVLATLLAVLWRQSFAFNESSPSRTPSDSADLSAADDLPPLNGIAVFSDSVDNLLDTETRRLMRLFINSMDKWPEAWQNVNLIENEFFHDIYTGPASYDPISIYNNFSKVLHRIDHFLIGPSTSNEGVYGLLFDIARGLTLSEPDSDELHWIKRALWSDDEDIVGLGGVLARCLPPELTLNGTPLLSLIFQAPRSDLLGYTAWLILTSKRPRFRLKSCPHMRELLEEVVRRDSPPIPLANDLTAALSRDDVDHVMMSTGNLDLLTWTSCFTPYLLQSLDDGHIPDLDTLHSVFAAFADPEPLLRSNMFYISACFQNIPDHITDLLWNGNSNPFMNDLPEDVLAEFENRIRSKQIPFELFLSSMSESDSLDIFNRVILPHCLKMESLQESTMVNWPVAQSWLRYVIFYSVLDESTFSIPMSVEDISYYNINSINQVLRRIMPGIVADLLPQAQLECPSDIMRDLHLPYNLIQASRILRNEILCINLIEISYTLIMCTLHKNNNSLFDVLHALRSIFYPGLPRCESTYYGPVFGHDPAILGTDHCNDFAVLALMHDCLLQNQPYVHGLVGYLVRHAPMPAQTLHWLASDAHYYEEMIGEVSESEAARLESSNFYFSLLDCIVDQINQVPDEEDPTCAVCLDDVNDDSKPVRLSCRHLFCLECIQPWISRRLTCPVCRRIHAHRLTRQRFRDLVAAGYQLPPDWAFWPQPTATRRSFDSNPQP